MKYDITYLTNYTRTRGGLSRVTKMLNERLGRSYQRQNVAPWFRRKNPCQPRVTVGLMLLEIQDELQAQKNEHEQQS